MRCLFLLVLPLLALAFAPAESEAARGRRCGVLRRAARVVTAPVRVVRAPIAERRSGYAPGYRRASAGCAACSR